MAFEDNRDIGWKLHQMFYLDVQASDPDLNWSHGVMQIVALLAGIIWKQQANIDDIITNWNAHPYKSEEKCHAQYK